MRFIILFFILFSCVACQAQIANEKPITNNIEQIEQWDLLLDPDLTRWDNYLSYRFEPGYDGSKPSTDPIGLNQPKGDDVFSTFEEDGETILRISGEVYGSIITQNVYRNYHLRLKVKWGDIKWNPRKELLKDSGILYHSVGPHGAEYWRSWMQGQELQIMEGHMGDYWSQATSAMDVRAYTPEYIMNPVGSTDQPFLSVGHKEDVKGLVIRSNNHESEVGEWTEIELISFEGQSLHIVNGHVVMVLKNSRYEKEGKVIPLAEGKIQLQSEAAEVFYKDIKVRNLQRLAPEHQALFTGP